MAYELTDEKNIRRALLFAMARIDRHVNEIFAAAGPHPPENYDPYIRQWSEAIYIVDDLLKGLTDEELVKKYGKGTREEEKDNNP